MLDTLSAVNDSYVSGFLFIFSYLFIVDAVRWLKVFGEHAGLANKKRG